MVGMDFLQNDVCFFFFFFWGLENLWMHMGHPKIPPQKPDANILIEMVKYVSFGNLFFGI